MGGFGEVLPYHENKMYLDYNKIDTFGLPKIVFDAEFKDNETKMKEDWKIQAAEMLEKAGCKEVFLTQTLWYRKRHTRNGNC